MGWAAVELQLAAVEKLQSAVAVQWVAEKVYIVAVEVVAGMVPEPGAVSAVVACSGFGQSLQCQAHPSWAAGWAGREL